MQTSLRRRHRDRVVRRGLALIIESDFYATDAGRAHFADQLTSIRYVSAPRSILRRLATRSPALLCTVRSASRRPATSTRSTLTCRRPTTTSPVRHTPHTPPWRLHACSHARRVVCCADDRAKNLRPKRNIKTAMNNEIMLYGIAQKEQLGFDKAVEECSAHAPLEPRSRSRMLTRRCPRAQSTECHATESRALFSN